MRVEVLVQQTGKRFVLTVSSEAELLKRACHKARVRCADHRLEGSPTGLMRLLSHHEVAPVEYTNTVRTTVTVVTSEELGCEEEARQQLDRLALHPAVRQIVAMPDLHAGPTGVVVLAEEPLPFLHGYDLGCGMSLFRTNISTTSSEVIRNHLTRVCLEHGEDPSDPWMGTLGGGNHFVELLQVDTTMEIDPALELDPYSLLLLVHSGSRGHGERAFKRFVHDPVGYMDAQPFLIDWAKRNRQTIARRFLEQFWHTPPSSTPPTPWIDTPHNFIEVEGTKFLHRKGAVKGGNGTLTLLPGSRGTASYILIAETTQPDFLGSLAHGAGRKMNRAEARHVHSKEDLTRGGTVVCCNTKLLREEAPYAYKDVDAVVRCMHTHGMCRVGARLLPVATYKTTSVG